ncbi:TrmH family RNA methyltransferase [Syntrophus gentianae]|nr:RNA methyltransferase [Syntrophus gentianae]
MTELKQINTELFPGLKDPSKAQLRLWSRLDRGKVRKETGLFLAEGYKIVSNLLDSAWKVQALLVREDKEERWIAFLKGLPANLPCYGLSIREWGTLTQDAAPEGIMAVGIAPLEKPQSDLILKEEGPLLLLSEINNPGNLGTIIRTAHWFGFSNIILSRGSVSPLNPKVIRAAMGSLFHISCLSEVDLSEVLLQLKGRYQLVGTSVQGGDRPHPCRKNTALLLGSESHGLPDSLLRRTDEQWHIPRVGGGESLSLPQAAAILMYECVHVNALSQDG